MSDTNGSRPGLLQMARAVIAAPFEERLLREEVARNERLRVDAANHMFGEAVKFIQPESDGFRLLGGSGVKPGSLDPHQADELRDRARQAAIQSPHVVGYLRSLKRFVMGTGPDIRAETGDDRLDARCQAAWERWAEWNDWDRLEDEIVLRTWRDGEVFNWAVPLPSDADMLPSTRALMALKDKAFSLEAAIPDVPDGMMVLRLVPPEDINDPTNTPDLSDGIITAQGDVQTVLGYMYAPGGSLKRVIPVSDLLHLKIGVDSDHKRGRTLVEPLLRLDKMYREWLDYRMALNYVRTAYAIVKKYDNLTPTRAAELRQNQAVTRNHPTNDRTSQRLKPGSTIRTNAEVSMLGPNLQAQDAQHDGRTLLLTMAAATGLPEYMFTADSSNSNFASTLVSESPALREFESWQDFFTPAFTWIYRKAIEAADVDGAPRNISELDVSVEFPKLLSRDELKHTQANQLRHDGGILSRKGWARDEGIDWEVEMARLDKERQADVEFTAPTD